MLMAIHLKSDLTRFYNCKSKEEKKNSAKEVMRKFNSNFVFVPAKIVQLDSDRRLVCTQQQSKCAQQQSK